MGQGGKKKNYAMQSKKNTRAAKKDNTLLIVIVSVVVIALIAFAIILFTRNSGNNTNNATISPTSTTSNTSATPPKITPSQKTTSTPAGSGDIKSVKVARVLIQTSIGDIEVDLRPDLMPITVDNFIKMVRAGYLNGLTFHRVEDWLIQGGDPTLSGKAEPDWTIKLETNPSLNHIRGAIGMARTDVEDSANSQFYIVKKDQRSIDGRYAIFGNVTRGMNVVDSIVQGDTIISVTEIK